MCCNCLFFSVEKKNQIEYPSSTATRLSRYARTLCVVTRLNESFNLTMTGKSI